MYKITLVFQLISSLVRRWPLAAVGVWGAAAVMGLVKLEVYANAPGRLADPPTTWPAEVRIDRVPGHYTLLMLAHPMCPCTRASLDELSRLMTTIHGEADAYVLFVDAAGTDHTDLWSQAEAIPGVHVVTDRASEVANTLHAYTSGQVLVYDPAGALAFNGGITASRGHEGDNTGESAIASIVRGEPAPSGPGSTLQTTSNVYGCELSAHERQR